MDATSKVVNPAMARQILGKLYKIFARELVHSDLGVVQMMSAELPSPRKLDIRGLKAQGPTPHDYLGRISRAVFRMECGYKIEVEFRVFIRKGEADSSELCVDYDIASVSITRRVSEERYAADNFFEEVSSGTQLSEDNQLGYSGYKPDGPYGYLTVCATKWDGQLDALRNRPLN